MISTNDSNSNKQQPTTTTIKQEATLSIAHDNHKNNENKRAKLPRSAPAL